jgi:hypothetical protein
MRKLLTGMLLVGVMLVMAAPVFAGERGADVQRIEEECGTGTAVLGACQIVTTPSGNINLWAHAHPRQEGPAAGGGASHELLITSCFTPQQTAKGVITPSGKVNVHCAGQR